MASNIHSETAAPSAADRLIERLSRSRTGQFAYRFRRLVPVASFAMGVASFFLVDRIPLEIVGGTRKQGYRAWSHKVIFGDDVSGDWRVAVITDDGQLIGARRFEIR